MNRAGLAAVVNVGYICAMLEINVESNIAQLVSGLSDFTRRQVPFATMKAINDTAFHVMRVERKAIPRYMENPTPFTQRSPRVQRAVNKRVPVAWVYIAPEAEEYIERLVDGGFEKPKGRALVSPISTRRGVLNKYGNIPRTFVKRAKANPQRYFLGVPRGRRGPQYAGVWERYGRGGRRVRQLVHFDENGRRVDKQYPFYRIAQVHGYTRFPRFFSKHLARAIATARV